MPIDPSENLPLAQLHVPALLNGRPTNPTTAATAAAATMARRRAQQVATAAAMQAQHQQAQYLAAAAAAQAQAMRQEEFKTDVADLTGVCDCCCICILSYYCWVSVVALWPTVELSCMLRRLGRVLLPSPLDTTFTQQTTNCPHQLLPTHTLSLRCS